MRRSTEAINSVEYRGDRMKEYMKEMRKLVGTRPIIMCGSSVIIYNPAGEVLMLHRTDNDSWCFPGGAIELGEKLEQTATREVFEEQPKKTYAII